MSIRTLNLVLRPFKLQLVQLRRQPLRYPRPGWLGTIVALPFWIVAAFYFTSLFNLRPELGSRGATCVLERVLSPTSAVLLALAVIVPLVYLVSRSEGTAITRKTPHYWLAWRIAVSFSFAFLGLFSKVGAVAFGVGLFLILQKLDPGLHLVLLGLWGMFCGEVFSRYLIPQVFRAVPALRRQTAIRGILLMAACIAISVLLGGILFGTWAADAPSKSGCNLVVQYE